MTDWNRYAPFFTSAEFQCQHCGKCEMDDGFMDRLLSIRKAYNRPMKITSGYRCAEHPIEAAKPKPGAHSSGHAADVGAVGADAHELIRVALAHGITGLGVNQKGNGRFIHLDDLQEGSRPGVWSY
jgi:zinc D-Ala-D-Ala carboxypeptidase